MSSTNFAIYQRSGWFSHPIYPMISKYSAFQAALAEPKLSTPPLPPPEEQPLGGSCSSFEEVRTELSQSISTDPSGSKTADEEWTMLQGEALEDDIRSEAYKAARAVGAEAGEKLHSCHCIKV